MGSCLATFKHIVAAAALGVWFFAPAAAEAQGRAEGRPESPDAREADLLRQLREAETADAAGRVETELHNLRSQSGSATVDLLLRRGQDALEAGTPEVAVEHLTAAIDHGPEFAEAYAARAAAYYLTARVGPAIEDLRAALVLEPDHLEALRGFAVILEELGRPEDALEIYRRVADMSPQDAEAGDAAERLALLIEGRTL